MRTPCSLCVHVCVSPVSFLMPEPVFMKLRMYIMAPKPISTAYLINCSHQSVFVYPLLLLLGNSLVNTFPWLWIHAAIEQLLDSWLSMQSMSQSLWVCVSP
jgi:hypothetical protein